MKNSNTIAAQFIKLIPQGEFNKLAAEHHTGQAFRKFTRFDQFVYLLTLQLTGRSSIRNLVDNFKAQALKFHHLSIHLVSRSSLSRINNEQSCSFYEAFFYQLSKRCKPVSGKHKFKFKNPLYSMDASTIDLCLSVYPWAKFKKTKGAAKLHAVINHAGLIPECIDITEGKTHAINIGRTIQFPKGSTVVMDRGYIDFKWFNELTEKGVFFVSRSKSTMKYRVIKRDKKIKSKGVTCDQYIELTSKKGERYQGSLRRVGYKDPESGKQYYFITNNKVLCAKTIADIYKDRCQIWVAMCAYLMLAYFRWSNGITRSVLSMAQLMQLCWFERRNIIELFIPPDPGKNSENMQLQLDGFMGH